MKITVIGSGYVGLVSGACLADLGNDVVCLDVDPKKIAVLNSGGVPIYEPGLDEVIHRNVEAKRLRFTTDIADSVAHGLVQMIAVGTPSGEDGSADLQYVLAAARNIARHMTEYKVIVDKSTVPVGTAENVRAAVQAELDRRGAKTEFSVVSNPEFLKEGAAIEDFNRPDRIVVGAEDERAIHVMREMYAPFQRNHDRLMVMDIKSAELTKYAANAMLAARITLMNQFANLCEKVGADVEHVRRGIGSDARIGKAFLFPGPGYGGSCFPKDVKALCATGRDVGSPLEVLECVEQVNERQKHVPIEKLRGALGSLKGRTVALWGLAFKAQTDDMREAAALVMVEELLSSGAKLRVHDPKALGEARRRFGDRVTYVEHRYDALDGADALVVLTEWQEYRVFDYDRARQLMKQPIVVDARNLYEPARMREHGFTYTSIGRH